MDASAYLLARDQALSRDSFMIRLRAKYAAKQSAQPTAKITEEASRFAPPPGGWPAPTGCDCTECYRLALRGQLDALPAKEISRAC